MKAVLDTNIIVSAFLSPRGLESLVLSLGLLGWFDLCVSEAVLAEYRDVLARPRFRHLNQQSIQNALDAIRSTGQVVHPARTLALSSDESDNRFYECAAAARANYLVTGNTRHFPVNHGPTRIVTARQFLEVLE